MTDNLSPEQRRKTMASVKSKDTTPEMRVRRLVHAQGLRFRLHREDLPGKPDLTFPRFNKLIFVHGCFWHGHEGCEASKRPASNTEYWNKKLERNRTRDKANQARLRALGWKPLIIWECQTRDREELRRIILRFFSN